MSQKKHSYEEGSDYPRACFDLFDISAENADDYVGDKTESDTVRDIVGKGHKRHSQECGNGNLEIVPFDIFNGHHHKYSHIDQSRCRSATWNKLCDGA